MKKFSRFLLVLLGVILIGVVVLGIVEPKDITVQRSIVINAPKSVVFDQIVHFKDWPHWSPWYQMDSTAVLTYSGTDGAVGSSYHWVGDKKKTGEGEMSNSGIAGTKMTYDLKFIEPFKGIANGSFNVADTTGGSSVTWSFSAHHGFPKNALFAFMNMDKMLGGDMERGLGNLKKYVEANATSMAGVAGITETDVPAMSFAGVRKQIGWSDMHQFFMDTYPVVAKEVRPAAGTHSFGLYYSWDTVKHTTDVAAVFPVTDTATRRSGIAYFTLPASTAYVATHNGGYSSMGTEHNALMKYVANKNKKANVVVEEYVVGPGMEKDSTKWVTKIMYLVQ